MQTSMICLNELSIVSYILQYSPIRICIASRQFRNSVCDEVGASHGRAGLFSLLASIILIRTGFKGTIPVAEKADMTL